MIDVSESELREGLAASLHVRRWVDDVAAEAPFADFAALHRVAHDRATPLSPAEVDEAVAAHPRIGERPTGDGRDAAFSRAEQEAVDSEDGQLDKALLEGNATYEERFGRVFLIRAAGRSRAEIVDELQRRLTLDDETELAIVGEELRDIALLRLEKLFGGAA
ncbi:Uric acid degradation bifunctional protein [Frondihabitans sp. 762G35]|uniref:2-oxo-4-hydroxy-4-carboxy-5-ureidoimidazoline decarboxylase n=1 Tax=Frondihabitans sp. 762G35 TaxID=1446794 RepID=UPI000D224DDE|nr:2-oxo-4-hydroxy-4-carboxy-5-ureidoimidazoline decarboxylase [Frondihabitans sp. 762G35]ARC58476.1 Uric acid degradation bifunctional protein [Frondihabitans sp. 762G35]